MRQKKKIEGTKLEPENPEACVKCSKLQNGRQNSFDEADVQGKQTTLSTLKSVLKRTSSHKKDKTSKIPDKSSSQIHNNPKDVAIVPKKTKNRVQFDESQNKYFEADYVILIHEEDYDLDDYYDEGSPYDDEDDDGYDDGMLAPKICCSNPNCNNTITLSNYAGYGYSPNGLLDVTYARGETGLGLQVRERDSYDFPSRYYDANYEEINRNTRKSSHVTTNRCENDKCQNCNNYFDFDMTLKPDTAQDFGDQVTLSPPEGYKDGGSQCCPHHHHHHQQQHHNHHHHHQGIHYHQNALNDTSQRLPVPRSIQFHQGENQSDPEEEEEEEEDDAEPYPKNDNSMEEEKAHIVENVAFDKSDGESSVLPKEVVDGDKEKPENLKQRFIVETITMTTVTEQRIVRESSEEAANQTTEDPRRGGILKGGKFWKNSLDKTSAGRNVNYGESGNANKSDEEIGNADEESDQGKSSQKTNQDGLAEPESKTTKAETPSKPPEEPGKPEGPSMVSPESTELTLTFKLGQNLLVSGSLKPNSAIRQLFPSPRFVSPPPLEDGNENHEPQTSGPPREFLMAAESLKHFEDAQNAKMLGTINSDESGQSFITLMPSISKSEEDASNSGFLRTIERNTLRRSLVKYSYEYRNKRLSEQKKNENSLEERIRQLTCGIDDEEPQEEKKDETKTDLEPSRTSPQGEESKEAENAFTPDARNPRVSDTLPTSSMPSSSSSSSSSGPSAYKKLTDLFSRKSNSGPVVEDINRNIKSDGSSLQCDLVLNSENLTNMYALNSQAHRNSLASLRNFAPRMTGSSDAKKQILSTLAPLTACVNPEEGERIAERYRLIEGGDRCAPSESEYSVQDIEDGLKNFEPKKLGNQPDVIAETPQNETPNDELALFVQQDSGRMEKLKKRYSAADDKSDDDDDDYGFNKRPLVKGIQMSASSENAPRSTTTGPPPPQQIQRFVAAAAGAKSASTTATTTTLHTNWPYYSQESSDPKLRQFYAMKQTEQSSSYGIYGNPQEYRGYAEAAGTTNYTEYKGQVGQQRINYVNQGQQQVYATTNTYYRCHPVRFGGYSELSNYQFRHPPHSPPPMRRIMAAPPQPSPLPSEDCKVRVENRVYVNRSNETYGAINMDNCSRLKVGVPDGSNVVSPPTDGMKTPEAVYHRRTVPNIHNPCLQMKFSPVNYHQGVVPTASIRFSATCAPPSVVDESNVMIEPHYSTFPHSSNQNGVGVIRVEQGQQMIRVPVPYATGTPVQVHLMAGRLRRCDSPQRPSSPQGAIKVPLPPYNHYLIAKGTQAAQPYTGTATAVTSTVALPPPPNQPPPPPPTQQQNSNVEPQPVADMLKTVDFEKQSKAIAEELQQRQKLALSRSLSQDATNQNRLSSTAPSSVNPLVQQERGVPEGAASSSVQDCQPPNSENPTLPPGNTIYYTMNI